MRRKGLYVLALVAMLGAAAGCGKNAEEAQGKAQNGQVTEAVTPKPTVTPELTAASEPTATPVPQTYMEKHGIRVLGAGHHEYTSFIWKERDEEGDPIMDTDTCECIFEVSEEDNEDGTKTIYATIHVIPYVYESGNAWCSSVMTGFVDLETGKSFLPYDAKYEHTTYLRRTDKNYEITVSYEYEQPSVTWPYHTESYTVVCPSDYEDAGFYLTGFTGNQEAFVERAGNWKLLNFIKHGTSELIVFSVNDGLATMPTNALQERIARGSAPVTENYFETNGLTTRGEGKTVFLGTEATNKETAEDFFDEETVVIETKDVEIEFQKTEEVFDAGRKQIRGSFIYPADITTDGFVKGVASISGVVDKKTGLSYCPFTVFLADPVTLDRGGEEISMMMAVEQSVTEENCPVLTYVVTCPKEYEDVAFYVTGNYRNKELREKRQGKWMPISEVEHGKSDLVFFE